MRGRAKQYFVILVTVSLVLLGTHLDLGAVQESTQGDRKSYDLEASERVRVTPTGGGERSVGHVLRATDDSLVLELRASPIRSRSEVAFAWGEIRDVERSVGREDHRRWAAVLAGGASAWVVATPRYFALVLPTWPGAIAFGLATLYRPHQWEALPREPIVGERIRIDRTTVGSMVSMQGPGLVLDPEDDGARRRTIPRENITHLERSLGARRHSLQGMLYGAALGLGTLFADSPYNWAGPPAGALLGLGVGALIETERWGEAVVP